MAVTQKEGLKFYLPLERVKALRDFARLSRRTVTSVIDQAIEEFLAKQANGSAASSPEKRSRAAQRAKG